MLGNRKKLLAEARKMVEAQKEAAFIERFETGKENKTDLIKIDHYDYADFYYGEAILNDNKLQGFKMMTFRKCYDEWGRTEVRSPVSPWIDENQNQVILSVKEFLDLEKKDNRWGALMHRAKIEEEAENIVRQNHPTFLQKAMDKITKFNR
jgi:septin family protein